MNSEEKPKRDYDSDWDYRTSVQNWRRYGSWFSWGSPVGLGLFFIELGIALYLLHLAGLVS